MHMKMLRENKYDQENVFFTIPRVVTLLTQSLDDL